MQRPIRQVSALFGAGFVLISVALAIGTGWFITASEIAVGMGLVCCGALLLRYPAAIAAEQEAFMRRFRWLYGSDAWGQSRSVPRWLPASTGVIALAVGVVWVTDGLSTAF